MKHVAFAAFLALYVITIGQNWGVYAAALMIAAWVRHKGQLTTRITPRFGGAFVLEDP